MLRHSNLVTAKNLLSLRHGQKPFDPPWLLAPEPRTAEQIHDAVEFLQVNLEYLQEYLDNGWMKNLADYLVDNFREDAQMLPAKNLDKNIVPRLRADILPRSYTTRFLAPIFQKLLAGNPEDLHTRNDFEVVNYITNTHGKDIGLETRNRLNANLRNPQGLMECVPGTLRAVGGDWDLVDSSYV